MLISKDILYKYMLGFIFGTHQSESSVSWDIRYRSTCRMLLSSVYNTTSYGINALANLRFFN